MGKKEDYITRKRMCIYIPVDLDKQLSDVVKEKKMGGEKTTKNQLSLDLIKQYLNGLNGASI